MKRIFVIGHNGNKGGVEKYIDQMTAELSQFEFVYSLPQMSIQGVVWRRPKNRHNYFRYCFFWRSFFRHNRFDAIYYNTCDIVSIDMLKFAKHAGVPIRIIHSHNTGKQQEISGHQNLFHHLTEQLHRRTLHKYATHILACSKAAGDWMFDGREYTVINNGISVSDYSFSNTIRLNIRKSYNLGEKIVIGIVGRISAQKNPLFVLRVLEEMIIQMPSVIAVFLGDGDMREQVENAAREEGIQHNVAFVGNVDNVNEWLSAFDVLLMPSLFEGLPFVLIEAQANGLPCVVSSTITQEANITGLLSYVDLNSTPEYWADKVILVAGKRKTNTAKQLAEAGYDICGSLKIVSDIIEGN